mmetsp:Transcript_2698/g.7986  ORF Transcript_2698/g.7986 Transcript_2698/m.7986 type:complete len:273 (+) Transcript_2698:311-1129(+)
MQSLQSPQLDAMLPSGTSPRSPVSSLRQIFMRQGQAGMVSRFSIRHLAADAVSGRVPRRWKPQAVPANYGAKPSSHAHSFSGLRADGGIVSLLSGGAGSFNCSCSAMSLGACQSCNSTNAHANKGGCSIRLRWRQQLGKQGMVLVNASNRSTGHQSMDSDEEGDVTITRELEAYDTERIRQMGRHLDLMWNFNQKPKPSPCACCTGSGSRSCEYCHSTGAMMVGHERFCSLEHGCKPCPVCNGQGEVKCFHCKGTGMRAGWLDEGCPVDPGL